VTPNPKASIAFGVLVACCLGAAILLVQRIDHLRPAATLRETLYVSSPQTVKRMSLGYTGLLADIYWTRAVQYFGRKHFLQESDYSLLGPLLDITTALDPHLLVAYEFGSVFLAQKPPNGAGEPDKAVDLVHRGIRENPGYWRLYYDLGFIHYMERKDYVAASRAFLEGSQLPDAHPFMKLLAARMAEHGGDIETARFLWTNTYQNSTNADMQMNALAHLRALQVDEQVEQLEAVARKYREQTGEYPENFQQLANAGWLRGVPLDPTGRPYRLVPGGKVEVEQPDELPFITEGLPPGMASPQFIRTKPKQKESK